MTLTATKTEPDESPPAPTGSSGGGNYGSGYDSLGAKAAAAGKFFVNSKVGKILIYFVLSWIALNIIVRLWDALPLDIDKINSTIISIIVALVISAALFTGLNLLFNLPSKSWLTFSAVIGGLGGAINFIILDGNRLLIEIGPRFVFWPLLGLIVGAFTLTLLSKIAEPAERMLYSVVLLSGLGIAEGLGWRGGTLPQLDWPVTILTAVIVAAGFGLLGLLFRRTTDAFPRWALVGFAAGWLLGSWGGAELGAGTRLEGIVASLVCFAAIGIRLGMTKIPDAAQRARIDLSSRKYIFLIPALGFISLGLLIPLARTIYLSLYLNIRVDGRAATVWGWFENYGFIFTSTSSLDFRRGWDFFSSRLLWWGIAFIVAAAVVMVISNMRSEERRVRMSGGSTSPMMIGLFLLVLAAFSVVRGTIINNLWWVFFVTVMTASLGLLIAVLADRAKNENIAKSLIFLPMSISFVGASLIWRFLYIARPESRNQTGLLNSLWVALGEISITDSWTIWLAAGILLAACVALLLFLGMSLQSGLNNVAVGSGIGALLVGFLLYRLIGPGLGGLSYYDSLSVSLGGSGPLGLLVLIVLVLAAMGLLVLAGANIGRNGNPSVLTFSLCGSIAALFFSFWLTRSNFNNSEQLLQIDGERTDQIPDSVLALAEAGERLPDGQRLLEPSPDTIFFLAEEVPFNNIWLMLVLIWTQTGFAMVIFSAALKAVPVEFIEAARVDGATESQIFWRITLPQIATTIGVVITTLIVLVMKVYDIVKVMTNGNFGTQVLANDMWQRSFTELNFGLGSALAVVLFLSVLPIMFYNIRRMQKLGV